MTNAGTAEVVVVTGAMASGKSTIAEALARSLPRAAHVHGDQFRRWIVSGAASMEPPLTEESVAQLQLRQSLAAQVARGYAGAGITAVVQDLYLGGLLDRMVSLLRGVPLRVVVLAPSAAELERRDAARGKRGYTGWTADQFDAELREATPRIGLWIDSTGQSPEQTVAEIRTRWDDALV